jgi:hypothetical protein
MSSISFEFEWILTFCAYMGIVALIVNGVAALQSKWAIEGPDEFENLIEMS